MDGIAGARVDLASGPSVDIANGAPTGADATNQIVMTWADGAAGLNHEQLLWTSSTQRRGLVDLAGRPLAAGGGPARLHRTGALARRHRPLRRRQRLHDAVPERHDLASRPRRARCGTPNVAGGMPGGWTSLDRGAVGDPRGTSQNGLTAEFLGDYVYARATRDGVVGVWNDAQNAGHCPEINSYRASLYTSSPISPPDVLGVCPATFGNSDIRGGIWADPTTP